MKLSDCSLGSISGGQLDKGATLAVAIRTPEDRALLDVAEGLEDLADLVLGLLLAQHAHEQLSVLASVALVVCGLHLKERKL